MRNDWMLDEKGKNQLALAYPVRKTNHKITTSQQQISKKINTKRWRRRRRLMTMVWHELSTLSSQISD